MNEQEPNVAGTTLLERAVLLLMLFSLLVMVLTMVVQRLANPSLVVQSTVASMPAPPLSPGTTGPMPEGASDMGEIGKLMQKMRERPNDAELKNELAEALMNIDQWDAAESLVRKALEKDPKNFKSTFLLGILLHRKQEYAEAAKTLEAALAIREDAEARYSLAILYLYFLKDREKGLFHLKEGLHTDSVASDDAMKKMFEDELKKNSAEQ